VSEYKECTQAEQSEKRRVYQVIASSAVWLCACRECELLATLD
jgi:hypothetical protein